MVKHIIRIAFLAALAALAAVVIRTTLRIERQSTRDEARAADVILILGAAEYRGKPSPVLKARLDHGLELYHQKMASLILTTGGAGGDPVFTEGGVGRDYLIHQGVPSEAIIVETEGESTIHSIAAAGAIMRRMGLNSCIIVSDGYHIYRAKKMLEAQGFYAFGSPRPSPSTSGPKQWWLYTRQAVGYLLWRWGVKI
ncbi:MAG: YdcF family protein [Acidobacteriota bacterium]